MSFKYRHFKLGNCFGWEHWSAGVSMSITIQLTVMPKNMSGLWCARSKLCLPSLWVCMAQSNHPLSLALLNINEKQTKMNQCCWRLELIIKFLTECFALCRFWSVRVKCSHGSQGELHLGKPSSFSSWAPILVPMTPAPSTLPPSSTWDSQGCSETITK